MAHVLAPKRNWVLLLPLCFHGLGLVVGSIVWLVYGLGHLVDGTSSARHLLRAPTAAERVGGRTWFTAPSEALTLARPIGGLVPSWKPTGDPAPLSNTDDPWGGCAIRRQRWVSGKNAAWHDAEAWSWGAYLLRDPQGGTVLVPLSSLTSASRSVMSPSEVSALLPSEPAPSAVEQYLRECFPERASVAVDGVVEGGVLTRGEEGTGARLETPERTRARARAGLAVEAMGLFGVIGPLLWGALLLAFVRQSFALRRALVSVDPTRWSTILLRGLGGAGLGVLTGGLAVVTGRVAPQMFLATTVAGSFAGVWLALAGSAAMVVRAFRDAMAGAEERTTKAREGKVVAPEHPAIGAVSQRPHAFVQLEAFVLTQKGAVSHRVMKTASHARIEASDGEGRFFVETAAVEVFGPNAEVRLEGSALRQRGLPGPFEAHQRYLLRETAFAAGAPLTVTGEATFEADPLARGEDYRAAGRSAVFVAREARGPLVFGYGRAALLAQATSDLTTLGVLRAVAGLLAVLVVVVPVVAVALGG